ncbi:hypothetical protein H2204_002939 [Knufia peltigerae]|uniref:Xylanolytic transcriptional activator regulatory domain-containing protein n=1 Tax=Knufia peltigerae TaxID=1002370 RepID=A0AA39D2H4_9EURO|nr:hypothetical protein H2204_002939 [Knufia peltigerae]
MYGRTVRFHPNSYNSSGPSRPIVFNTIPKRGSREAEGRALAASECASIEKTIEPYRDELTNLFFEKMNISFPIFDESLFRRLLATQKEKISPGLLATLYGNTLTYWDSSPRLRVLQCPDHYSIWIQAENAMTAEFKCTPGISTIISIILNLSGRPSSHMLGNGGLLGMAVALANAFGLNRDPTVWNLSPTEKKFRIRIWRILLVYDRWCSLAYGTPPLIHRTQHDVPAPAAEDLYSPCSSTDQIAAAHCFVAFTTLTDVLGHCLELVYRLGNDFSKKPEGSPLGLENLLTHWEDSLSDSLRRLVIRGTGLAGPGAANLRLAYLSVKLVVRRCQLDLDRASLQINDVDSLYYIQARRVSEEIVDFVRELDETHCRDFWIPLNAYSLTSATTFLMRSALTSKGLVRNPSLQLAKAMIDALRSLRHDYAWDLADNCLSNCSDLMEKIEAACQGPSSNTMELQEPMPMDMDIAALNGLFSEFTGNYFLDTAD